jgi:hypothetical protein
MASGKLRLKFIAAFPLPLEHLKARKPTSCRIHFGIPQDIRACQVCDLPVADLCRAYRHVGCRNEFGMTR